MLQGTSISRKGAVIHYIPGMPVFTAGALVFIAGAQGIPLGHLALVARGAYVPGSIIRETVLGRLPPTRHHTENRLNHTLPFCERGLLARLGAPALGAGFGFGIHLEVTELLAGNTG